MSPDTLDTFICHLADWIDHKGQDIHERSMNDDEMYEALSDFVYLHLEPYCTRDRNYN